LDVNDVELVPTKEELPVFVVQLKAYPRTEGSLEEAPLPPPTNGIDRSLREFIPEKAPLPICVTSLDIERVLTEERPAMAFAAIFPLWTETVVNAFGT
jgi:hypothetical protein